MNISGLGMLIVEYEMKSNQGKKKKDYLNVNYLTISFYFIYFSHFLVIVWVENNIFYSSSEYILKKKNAADNHCFCYFSERPLRKRVID